MFDFEDLLGDVIVSGLSDVGDGTSDSGWDQNVMDGHELVLVDVSDDISSDDSGSDLDGFGWGEFPFSGVIEGWHIDSDGDEDGLTLVSDLVEGSLDTIENFFQDTWGESDGEGVLGSEDWISDSKTGGILVALNGSLVSIQLNNFSDQLVPTDLDQFVHLGSDHLVSNDQWTSDLEDSSVVGFSFSELLLCSFSLIYHLYYI